jgi:methyl-accepting chemotaxis protein
LASSTQVENGVKLVNETGKSLERIMGQVSEITTIVAQIAAGAKEQSIGLGEVNTAISQMDQVTQQNAAMVEQTTAASHSLTEETEQLSGLIGQFLIGQVGGKDSMRRELQKAAPHAFRPGPKATPANSARAETRKPASRPVRSASKAVVNGGAVGTGRTPGRNSETFAKASWPLRYR